MATTDEILDKAIEYGNQGKWTEVITICNLVLTSHPDAISIVV